MAGHRIASLLKASPEGEGIHPSQIGTLSSPPRRTQRTRRKNPVLNRFEPPILRVPRGGEVIWKRTLRARRDRSMDLLCVLSGLRVDRPVSFSCSRGSVLSWFRAFVFSCFRGFVVSCFRVFVVSCFRVFVCSCVRAVVCSWPLALRSTASPQTAAPADPP